MKIVIGSDRAGLELKDHLVKVLKEKGHELVDVGVDAESRTSHPNVARAAAEEYKKGGVEFGILACGSGTGISIAANKVKGIRCALLNNLFSAKIAKELNKANFIAFGGQTLNAVDAEAMVDAYMGYAYRGSEDWVRVWDEEIDQIEADNK